MRGKYFLLLGILFLFVLSSGLVSAFNWTDGSLVSYYKLDNNNFNDSLGENNGINFGTANTSGIILDGRDFEYNESDYINIGNNTVDFTDGNFTLNAWVKLENNSFELSHAQVILAGENSAYGFYIAGNDTAGDRLTFGKIGVDQADYGTTNITKNVWIMATITYDKDGDVLRYYVDGTAESNNPISYSSTFTSSDIFIGKNGQEDYGFDGKIDEVGIWNRTLSSSEIQELYNNGSGLTYNSSSYVPPYFYSWDVNLSDGFNTTHFANVLSKLTLSESWLTSFINSRISSVVSYTYIYNLGFYPLSNPSNFYNATTLPPQSGTSFKSYNLTTADVVTNDSTGYNKVIFTLPLTAGKKVSIECNLLTDAAATTTGIQLNSTLLGTSSRRQSIEYYTSATAQAICQGATNESLTCSATSSAGTIVTPTRINIYTVQQNNSLFILKLKSEVAGSNVYVRAGSWCRSTEFN